VEVWQDGPPVPRPVPGPRGVRQDTAPCLQRPGITTPRTLSGPLTAAAVPTRERFRWRSGNGDSAVRVAGPEGCDGKVGQVVGLRRRDERALAEQWKSRERECRPHQCGGARDGGLVGCGHPSSGASGRGVIAGGGQSSTLLPGRCCVPWASPPHCRGCTVAQYLAAFRGPPYSARPSGPCMRALAQTRETRVRRL
jgi:hypothetical protein